MTSCQFRDDVGMRILLLATPWPDILAEQAATVAAGAWQEHAPADHVVARAWVWGGPELPQVLSHAGDSASALSAAMEPQPGPQVVRLADVFGTEEVSSAALGEVLTQAIHRKIQELVVAFDHQGPADGGQAMLTHLAQHAVDSAELAAPQCPPRPFIADSEDRSAVVGQSSWRSLRGSLPWADRHGVKLVGLTTSKEPYFRPGLARGANPTAEHHRHLQRLAVADNLRQVLAEPDLQRLVGTPGAGCVAGLGLGWLALGGQLVPGPQHTAGMLRLFHGVTDYDAVVVCVPVLDWRSLRDSDVTVAAQAAAEAAVPVLVVAGAVEVGRRELAAAGVHAAYACTEAVLTPSGELPEPVPVQLLAQQMRRVAATWSR